MRLLLDSLSKVALHDAAILVLLTAQQKGAGRSSTQSMLFLVTAANLAKQTHCLWPSCHPGCSQQERIVGRQVSHLEKTKGAAT